MRSLKALNIFLLMLLFGCAATTGVLSEYDDEIDFNYYEKYVLCIDDFYVDNTKYSYIDNNYVRELIGQEIDNQMASFGYKTNVVKPQLQAGFKISIEEKESVITNCDKEEEFGYWKTCTISTVVYTKETLIAYVSDIEKNQIIWQASIPCELNKSKKKLENYINTLVKELFLEYPERNN